MTIPPVSSPVAALARATQLLLWSGLVLSGLLIVLVPVTTTGTGSDVLWVVRGALTLIFAVCAVFVWRFTTWIGRIAHGTVSAVESRRVATWLRFWQVASILGVILGAYELAALLLRSPDAAARVTKLSPLDEIANLLTFLSGAGLLWTARKWVLASAPASDAPRGLVLQAAVRSMQPWVRATQVLVVLALIKALWQPNGVPAGVSVLGCAFNLVLLDYSLRFAWASAQDSRAASPPLPSLP